MMFKLIDTRTCSWYRCELQFWLSLFNLADIVRLFVKIIMEASFSNIVPKCQKN